jgi:hypothetical protein
MLCALVELVLHVIRKLQMDAVRPVRGECHTSTPPAVLPAISDGNQIRETISAARNGEAASAAAPTTSSSPGKETSAKLSPCHSRRSPKGEEREPRGFKRQCLRPLVSGSPACGRARNDSCDGFRRGLRSGEAPRSRHLSEHRPGGGPPHALKPEDNPLPASARVAQIVLAALPLAGGGENLRTSHP